MRKILLGFIVCMVLFACKKDNEEIKGTRNLKNLSLPKLKGFLNGKWRLQYSVISTIAGVKTIQGYDARSYIAFYSVDSIMRISETSNVIIREKIVYEWLPISRSESAYVLRFNKDGFGYLNNWVADRLINDTIVFANYFLGEGINNYYFTKEQ